MRTKLIKDYGYQPPGIDGSMKHMYHFNNLLGFGSNFEKQLGLDKKIVRTPTKIKVNGRLFKAKEIACGQKHSLVLDLNNVLWGMGNNERGQLGINSNKVLIPTRILKDENPWKIKQIACGANHSLVIDMNDDIWGFGANDRGQLGLNDRNDRNYPTIINNLKALQISANYDTSFIIDFNYHLWGSGNNEFGQLGVEYPRFISTFTLISDHQFKKIFTAYGYSAAIDLDDNLWIMSIFVNRHEIQRGQSTLHQIRNGLNPIKVKMIGEYKHPLFIDFNNDLYIFGFYEEDIELIKNNIKYVFAIEERCFIIDFNNDAWGVGDNVFGELGPGRRYIESFIKLANIKANKIACGEHHTLLIM